MLKNMKDTVRVEGKGASKEAAFGQAFNRIQKEVTQKYGKIMVRLEPLDVAIVMAEVEAYTEKFFFFFFPRKRQTYRVVLDVEVMISYLDEEEVTFEEVVAKRSSVGKATGLPAKNEY